MYPLRSLNSEDAVLTGPFELYNYRIQHTIINIDISADHVKYMSIISLALVRKIFSLYSSQPDPIRLCDRTFPRIFYISFIFSMLGDVQPPVMKRTIIVRWTIIQ